MRIVRTMLLCLSVFMASCSAPATQASAPAASATPLPPPTASAVPTATVPPSPTPDPLLFRDDFEGALGPGWQWVHEKPNYWSLAKKPGWLEIMARAGHVPDGSITNLLTRAAPKGNFELETRVNFRPAGNFQAGGLLIYESAAHVVQFARAYCNAPQCAGDGFYLDVITDGQFGGDNFATKAPDTDTVYLRLRREGSSFTAYASADGATWKLIGSQTADIQPMFVGLLAGQALGTVPKPAQFDYFLINALP